MSTGRIADVGKLAWLPAGHRSKWAVLVFWVIVAALAVGPARLLMGAQKNDAVSRMTRVHEEAKEVGTRRGALIGLGATGGVITSAGLVLAGTFAVLATLPVVSFAEIGFAVALGVLIDTMIVRPVLVTALNLDIGRHMWWPSSLARQADPAPRCFRRSARRAGAMSGAEEPDPSG